MIYENAHIEIDPAQAEQFEAAVSLCAPLFRAARGCTGMSLERQIENPAHYILRVQWETVEDHMVHFRNSAEFQRWRALAGPFFAMPPDRFPFYRSVILLIARAIRRVNGAPRRRFSGSMAAGRKPCTVAIV